MTTICDYHGKEREMPQITGDPRLALTQEVNCVGCKFADTDKIGTGEPCCQYPGPLDFLEGQCLKRRES